MKTSDKFLMLVHSVLSPFESVPGAVRGRVNFSELARAILTAVIAGGFSFPVEAIVREILLRWDTIFPAVQSGAAVVQSGGAGPIAATVAATATVVAFLVSIAHRFFDGDEIDK